VVHRKKGTFCTSGGKKSGHGREKCHIIAMDNRMETWFHTGRITLEVIKWLLEISLEFQPEFVKNNFFLKNYISFVTCKFLGRQLHLYRNSMISGEHTSAVSAANVSYQLFLLSSLPCNRYQGLFPEDKAAST
jgi:hypothetical protein